MLFSQILNFALWSAIIEFIGALLIVFYLLAACISLFKPKNIVMARLIVADGVITGLSFKVAGTLLKTIELHTWQQILMFVAIFALRTILKQVFSWERDRLRLRLQG